MSRIVAYELLTADDPKELNILVNEKLSDGWKLAGRPFVYEKTFYQAVVLTAKAQKRIRKGSEDAPLQAE